MSADAIGSVSDALRLRGVGKADQVEGAARFLTSVFMKQMIEQMWETVPDGGLVPKSSGERIFRGFLSEKLASDLSRRVPVSLPKSSAREALQNPPPATDTEKGGGFHGYRVG